MKQKDERTKTRQNEKKGNRYRNKYKVKGGLNK